MVAAKFDADFRQLLPDLFAPLNCRLIYMRIVFEDLV